MMGFYQTIRQSYGNHATRLMKQWSGMSKKLANYKNRRIFLLRCRKMGILPKHIIYGVRNVQGLLFAGYSNNIADRVKNFIDQLGFKILSLEIQITCDTISRIERFIHMTVAQLGDLIPDDVLVEYDYRLKQNFNKLFNNIKRNNVKKYNRLVETVPFSDEVLFLDNSNWFKNISTVDIPVKIKDLLSLGPKFSVPSLKSDVKVDHFLADVEKIIDEAPDNVKENLRAKVTNVVTNYLHNSHVDKNPPKFYTIFKEAKNFLKEHPDLYILQADKGGCTVAMNKADYIEKTEILLLDESTYVRLERDPTTTIQTKYNNLIKNLKLQKEITEQEAKELSLYNSSFPKLYCLPKVHKIGIPLRPIVSCINAPTYNVSKYLSNILKVALGERTEYNITDTFAFVDRMVNMTLPENYVLISFDVISLFTNIPLELVVRVLECEWDRIKTHTTLSKEKFLKLITFVFDNTYFGFNDKFYRQIFGTPMGSPISPIVATIVLDFVLDTIIPKLPFKFPFIYKYVDDIICSIPEDSIRVTLDVFNSVDNRLQFTMETEKDRSVPFLDTKVIRTYGNSIVLDWYQKPTASGRFLNYHSNHPKKQKFNTVIAMRNRITSISDNSFLQKNLKKLFSIFMNNGYPEHILKKLIFNTGFYDGPTDDTSNNIKYRKLPFIKNLTEKTIKIFKEYPSLKIAKYHLLNNFKLFSHVKQKTPVPYCTNTVYKLSCLNCPSTYIGQTSQWVKQRMTQHRSDCEKKKRSCAVVDHHLNTGHRFDFQNVKILERESDYRRRLFLEMSHINWDKSSINYRTDTNRLSNLYCNILES